MKTLHKFIFLFLPLFALSAIYPFQITIAQQASISPTPTYDPLEEPRLPSHPTEFELGRNLYWHWCMTCHGDRGQGLTDEFRAIWEPEHQNCWGRGCHAGRPGGEGFPIPTIVPAIMNNAQLIQFASVQELSDFLKATHPPQSPGVLTSEEYHAMALFVFTMNGRSLAGTSITETATPNSTPMLVSPPPSASHPFGMTAIIVIAGLMTGIFVLVRIPMRGA